MKRVNFKSVAAIALFSLFAVSVSAQPQHKAPQGDKEPLSAEKMAEIATDKLDQKLELTDAQESKIYAINLKYAKQREEQMAERKAERPERPAKGEKPSDEQKAERPDREAMAEKMKAAQAERKAQMVEIMKVLTDEQKIDYAFMLSQEKPKRGPQGPQGAQAGQGRGPQGKQGQGGAKCDDKDQKGQKGKQGQGGDQPRRPERGERGEQAPQE